MRNYFFKLAGLSLVCLLAASCATNAPNQAALPQETRSTVAAAVQNTASPADATPPPDMGLSLEIMSEASPSEPTPPIETLDTQSEATQLSVDLTALSSTMVYAEVYNLMINPDGYVGKTITGSGWFDSFYYQEIDRHFHYLVISDAMGCCPQGLDFVWVGEHRYPEDYPAIGDFVEITGVFTKGDIDGNAYYHIAVDDLTVLTP